MTIKEKIEQTVSDRMVMDSELRKLADFYQEMEKEGLVLKRSYNLPPLDTIGFKFYSEQKQQLE